MYEAAPMKLIKRPIPTKGVNEASSNKINPMYVNMMSFEIPKKGFT